MTGKPEEKTIVGNICRSVHDTRVNGQPMRRSQLKGNVLVFRNPENRTRLIVFNILDTENQGLCAARKEIVTVQ